MTVENSASPKKPRLPRRQSLPALVAKLGKTPTAIEQRPDGTIRFIFADGPAVPTQTGWDDVA